MQSSLHVHGFSTRPHPRPGDREKNWERTKLTSWADPLLVGNNLFGSTRVFLRNPRERNEPSLRRSKFCWLKKKKCSWNPLLPAKSTFDKFPCHEEVYGRRRSWVG